MRRVVALTTAVLVAGVAVPALGATVPTGSATTLLDAEPLCGATPGTSTSDDGVLTIGTYNLLHSQSEEDDKTLGSRLPLAADAVTASGADVVGLQEVVKNEQFDAGNEFPQKHGNVAERLASELTQRTDETWHWCWVLSNPHFPGEPDLEPGGGGGPLTEAMVAGSEAVLRGDFRIGEALVSRLPIVEARSRRYAPRSYEAALCVPPDPINCNLAAVFDSRQLLWARIDAGSAGEFDMFTTHIAHGLTAASDVTKRIQVETALQYIAEWSDPATPDFFVGDFNSEPGSDRHQAVLDAGFVDSYLASGAPECTAADRSGCTSNQDTLTGDDASTTTRRIDYVFARSCGIASGGSAVLGDSPELQTEGEFADQYLWPSDHFGVASETTCG